MADITPQAPVFEQHPDTLMKKAVREEPVETPAIDPAVVAATEAADAATFKELKEKLPSLLFNDKPKAATPAAAPAAVVPATPAVEEPPVVDPVKKKVKVTKQATPAEIAEMAAEAVLARTPPPVAPVAPAPAPAPVVPVEDPTANLSDVDKETYELFKVLSESEPQKYGNKHKEFAAFAAKASVYKKRWEKANPGETFDASDDAHEDFYSKNQPTYTELDLDKARIRREASLEVARRLDAQKTEYDVKLKEFENKTVGVEVSRAASRVADTATQQFVGQLTDPTIKAALAKGPDALKEADPIAFDVLNNAAVDLQRTVVELHSIVNRQGYFNQNNPVHQQIAGFVDQQEHAIKQLPAAQQVYEGKRFVSRAEYAALPPAARPQYWVLTEEDVVHMLTQRTAAQASKTLESERKRMESVAVKYGFAKTAAATATQAPAAQPAGTPARVAKPATPAGSAGEAAPPLGAPAGGAPESTEKKLVKSLF